MKISHAGTAARGASFLRTDAGVRRRQASMRIITREREKMKQAKIYFTILALAATTAAALAEDAGANWDKGCKKCHGADGKGATPMGKKLEIKDFTDAKYQAPFTDEQATKAIKEGVKDGDKTRMKPAEGLTDEDIKALVAKVRAFKQ
jgi:cytochrome c553